jgi:hypothetical protein
MDDDWIYEHPYLYEGMQVLKLFIEIQDYDTVQQLVEKDFILQPSYIIFILYGAIVDSKEVQFALHLMQQLINRRIVQDNNYTILYIIALALLDSDSLLTYKLTFPN